MGEGLASKLENRMWYFGETERQAQDALQRIEEENLKAMKQELAMQYNERQQENDVEAKQNWYSQRDSQQKLNQAGIKHRSSTDTKSD